MDEREMIRRWVEAWKLAGPELEAIRRREVREADNYEVMEELEDAFKSCAPNHAAEGVFGDGRDAEVVC